MVWKKITVHSSWCLGGRLGDTDPVSSNSRAQCGRENDVWSWEEMGGGRSCREGEEEASGEGSCWSSAAGPQRPRLEKVSWWLRGSEGGRRVMLNEVLRSRWKLQDTASCGVCGKRATWEHVLASCNSSLQEEDSHRSTGGSLRATQQSCWLNQNGWWRLILAKPWGSLSTSARLTCGQTSWFSNTVWAHSAVGGQHWLGPREGSHRILWSEEPNRGQWLRMPCVSRGG